MITSHDKKDKQFLFAFGDLNAKTDSYRRR